MMLHTTGQEAKAGGWGDSRGARCGKPRKVCLYPLERALLPSWRAFLHAVACYPHPVNGVARPRRDAGRFRVILVRISAEIGVDARLVKRHRGGEPLVRLIAPHGHRAIIAVQL